MPPECPSLPGLASLLNPLKFKNTSEYMPETTLTFSSNSQSSPSAPSPLSSSVRTSRCRVCKGCQSQPCGICCFCKDSVPFGGPGIKKQTCIERKCVVLLENRFQKPIKKTLKLKVKENKDKNELPKKPKRVYKRRSLLPKPRQATVSLSDEHVSEIKEENASNNQANNLPKDFDHSHPQTPVPNLSLSLTSSAAASKSDQSPEIQRYINPSKSLIQIPQLKSGCQSDPLPESTVSNNNKNQTEFKQSNFNNKIIPNSSSMNCHLETMHQHPNSSNYCFSNGSMQISYRRIRYLKFSNNFDFGSSNALSEKCDPFIPPSYSGREEVILQAL
uniref:CXXC-type domain-containing protein n=1 Tax=Panagrolaimus sp. ES5 TaxID=591445 RepID=A0AC34G5U6_9BILA